MRTLDGVAASEHEICLPAAGAQRRLSGERQRGLRRGGAGRRRGPELGLRGRPRAGSTVCARRPTSTAASPPRRRSPTTEASSRSRIAGRRRACRRSGASTTPPPRPRALAARPAPAPDGDRPLHATCAAARSSWSATSISRSRPGTARRSTSPSAVCAAVSATCSPTTCWCSTTAARASPATASRSPVQEEHERDLAARYPYYHNGVRLLEEDVAGPLSRALSAARRALKGLSVAIDARVLVGSHDRNAAPRGRADRRAGPDGAGADHGDRARRDSSRAPAALAAMPDVELLTAREAVDTRATRPTSCTGRSRSTTTRICRSSRGWASG